MIDIEQFLMSLRKHKNADGKLNPIHLAGTLQEEIEIIEEAIKHSQRWVGLTDEEIKSLPSWWPSYEDAPALIQLVKDVETKLREKNT
jgi:hypothetical protein